MELHSIHYASDGLRVHAFVLRPVGPKRPVIVYARGGNNHPSNKHEMNLVPEDMLSSHWRLFPLAKRGFTVIATNFRGSRESEGVDEAGGTDVNDLLNLGPTIEEYGDASDVSLFGWSMGGQKLLQLLLRADRASWVHAARACVVGAPSTNLMTFKRFRPDLWRHWKDDFGLSNAALLERSVVRHVDKLAPVLRRVPLLLLHGEKDAAVAVSDTLDFAQALTKAGVTNFGLVVYPDDDHGMSRHADDVTHQVARWVRVRRQ